MEAERAAAIIAALQQEAAEIKAEKERLLASQDQHLERERADKQRLAEQLQATEVILSPSCAGWTHSALAAAAGSVA